MSKAKVKPSIRRQDRSEVARKRRAFAAELISIMPPLTHNNINFHIGKTNAPADDILHDVPKTDRDDVQQEVPDVLRGGDTPGVVPGV